MSTTSGTTSRLPSLAKAMTYASLAFAVVSVLAYSIWAFRVARGAPMYAAVAAVYVAGAGIVLSRLVQDPRDRKRFPLWFALGFTLYAVLWCAFWFGLRGRYQADLFGAVVGLAALAAVLRVALRSRSAFLPSYLVLLVCHSVGYYLGGIVHAQPHASVGALLWGACHGLGFGAGLGFVLRQFQLPAPTTAS